MDRIKRNKFLVASPLLLGIVSIITFVIYFYSANHAPYSYTGVIFAGPIFSLAGVVISIITRKSRKTHPTLWTMGMIVCIPSFLICFFVILLLAWIAMSMFNGTWL